MKTTELSQRKTTILSQPAVRTYLETLQMDSIFNEVHEFDVSYLEAMAFDVNVEIGPHPRATVLLEKLLFNSRSSEREMLITHVRDLRALAWRSALALRGQGFKKFEQ